LPLKPVEPISPKQGIIGGEKRGREFQDKKRGENRKGFLLLTDYRIRLI